MERAREWEPSTLPHAGCRDRPAASCYLLMESCLSRQGQLVCGDRGTRRRRRCKSALHRGRETGP
nr:MAG TPA: hypothetical protein [Caudoviricetes sp.]DAW88849.1 MAG TPA: hypothetical protein [Caudoviricetes sp.]